MAVWPVTFATSAPLSEDPPIPIAGTLVTGTGAWSCTFDKPLQPATLDFLNWTINTVTNTWNPTSASSAGSVVSGASTQGLLDPLSNVINFAPPPFDVLDLQDRQAAAFTGFPIVVT